MNELYDNLKEMRVGLILSLLTIAFGFGLGAFFGAFEKDLKGYLEKRAGNVLATAYNNDTSKMRLVTKKSWNYFKRAHLHANGLGTTSLILIMLLSVLNASNSLKSITAGILGAGSLGYSWFWLLAGLNAPGLGSNHLAKESLKIIAIPTSGMCIVGLLTVIGISIFNLFSKRGSKDH